MIAADCVPDIPKITFGNGLRRIMIFFYCGSFSLGKKTGRSDLAQATPAQRSGGMVVMGGYLELDIMQGQGDIRSAAMHHSGIPLSKCRLRGRICRNRRITGWHERDYR